MFQGCRYVTARSCNFGKLRPSIRHVRLSSELRTLSKLERGIYFWNIILEWNRLDLMAGTFLFVYLGSYFLSVVLAIDLGLSYRTRNDIPRRRQPLKIPFPYLWLCNFVEHKFWPQKWQKKHLVRHSDSQSI